MVLKRRDGTPYQLTGPNPIMNNQSFWQDGAIMHNFHYEDFVVEPKPIQQEKLVTTEKPNTAFYCLPAYRKIDPVYGDVKVTYGIKFETSLSVISSDDIRIVFQGEPNILGEDSIIFSAKDRRWWRVMTAENGTYLCVPSLINPSF